MSSTLAQISDAHLGAGTPLFRANFDRVVAALDALRPDVIVHAGDASLDGAGGDADLVFAAKSHARLPRPVLCVPGNHDVGDHPERAPKQPVDDAQLNRFRHHLGRDRWVEDRDGWRLLGLNSQMMGAQGGGDGRSRAGVGPVLAGDLADAGADDAVRCHHCRHTLPARARHRGGADAGRAEQGERGAAAFDVTGGVHLLAHRLLRGDHGGVPGGGAGTTAYIGQFQRSIGPGVELRTARMPVITPGGKLPTGGNAVVMLTKDAARQAAAWRFMQFAAGPAGQIIMVRGTGYVTSNTLTLDNGRYLGAFYRENPLFRPAMEQIPLMQPWYAFPGSNGVRITTTIVDNLARIVEQKATPEAVLADVTTEVQKLLPRG